jgi:hypothetical protein
VDKEFLGKGFGAMLLLFGVLSLFSDKSVKKRK